MTILKKHFDPEPVVIAECYERSQKAKLENLLPTTWPADASLGVPLRELTLDKAMETVLGMEAAAKKMRSSKEASVLNVGDFTLWSLLAWKP